MSRLFDAYIMVDWSAASKPVTGKNSIWIGILAKDARLKLQQQALAQVPRAHAERIQRLHDVQPLLCQRELVGRGVGRERRLHARPDHG